MVIKNSNFIYAKMFFLSLLAIFILVIPAIASPDYEVQQISNDIYAVIRKEPPSLWFNPNTIFIIGKKDVVVVDSNISSEYTREVLAELKKLTDKPVKYVINTHWHEDHIIGNRVYREAFPKARIYRSRKHSERFADHRRRPIAKTRLKAAQALQITSKNCSKKAKIWIRKKSLMKNGLAMRATSNWSNHIWRNRRIFKSFCRPSPSKTVWN